MRALVVGAAVALGCSGPPPQPPAHDTSCEAACGHARELGCPEGRPTAAGASCEAVCENAARLHIDVGTACMAQAPTCDALARCRAR